MNKKIIYTTLFTISISSLYGCSNPSTQIFPKFGGKIQGTVWCDQRYLDMVDEYQRLSNDTKKQLNLSKNGYIYALVATLTLQKDNSDKEFNFITPSYLKKINELSEEKNNGFAADTYIYRNLTSGENEIIIAFRGSDDFFHDYILQNLAAFQLQNKTAREYVKKAVNYRNKHRNEFGRKVVVVGNSLGGALAAHVTNHPDTANLITDAWVFNPSPRTGVLPPSGGNPKIRLLSTSSEVLNITKRKRIGVQEQNRYTNYDLIESSSIYNHYRWVLTREILWYADFALYLESDKKAISTPPLEIIKAQKITSAHCEITNKLTKQRRSEYESRNKENSNKSKGSISLDEVIAVDSILDDSVLQK
ncbi:Mbeg1-like protein [Klebsiella variicola]